MTRAWLFFIAAGLMLLLSGHHALAQTVPNATDDRELVIATKLAPPFAMKDKDGNWTGISIELWQHVANRLNLRYHLVEEPTVQALIDKTAAKAYDAAIAAITVTASRESVLDFSQPYYVTGLGIAVARNGPPMWNQIGRTLLSFSFLQAVLALLGIAVAVALLIWVFERRHNEEFGGSTLRGIGSSMWWSAEAMTQASTGFRGPKTMPGRIVAMVWMVASIITVAVFTAGVTTALTARKLEGLVREVGDLGRVRVGAVTGSATTDYLSVNRIHYRGYKTPEDGVAALQSGTIDAFVYDKPLLAWLVLQRYSSTIEVLEIDFDPQYYAAAFQPDSKLRKRFDIAVLEEIKGDWWKQTLFRYLGE
jgi:polar amino acid transport system substrate-binding protein